MLYAAQDRSDRHHNACERLLRTSEGPLLVPTLVVTEVCYFLERSGGAEAEVRLLGALAAGDLLMEHPSQADLIRMAELVWRYRDWPLGAVDASVVALAERLGVATIGTLDRRHFGAIKPAHVDAFDILP